MRTANASLLTAVLLALSSILLLGAPAHAADPLTDESLIIDEADVLDEQLLVEEINSLEGVIDDPGVRFAVIATDSASELNYDETVIEHILELAPAGIVTEHGGFVSDIVIITISPELRQLGMYSGPGAPDAAAVVNDALAEMRPRAQAGEWDNTAFAGVQVYLHEHELIETAESDTDASQSSSNTLGNIVGIIGVAIIGLMMLCVGFFVVIFAGGQLLDMLRQRAYRKTYPSSTAHVNNALALWKKVRDEQRDLDRILGADELSNPALEERTARAITALEEVSDNGYTPPKSIAGDKEVRELTDTLAPGQDALDAVRQKREAVLDERRELYRSHDLDATIALFQRVIAHEGQSDFIDMIADDADELVRDLRTVERSSVIPESILVKSRNMVLLSDHQRKELEEFFDLLDMNDRGTRLWANVIRPQLATAIEEVRGVVSDIDKTPLSTDTATSLREQAREAMVRISDLTEQADQRTVHPHEAIETADRLRADLREELTIALQALPRSRRREVHQLSQDQQHSNSLLWAVAGSAFTASMLSSGSGSSLSSSSYGSSGYSSPSISTGSFGGGASGGSGGF